MTFVGTASVRVGCAGLPPGVGRGAYFHRLRLLELDLPFAEPPRDAVLRRWRREAGSAAVTVRARIDSFTDRDRSALGWDRTLGAARVLGVQAIVFHTPPSFTPGGRNRETLSSFFREVARTGAGDPTLVWEPGGVWRPAEAFRLAEELGLLLAYDPLAPDLEGELPPPPDRAYFRLQGLGLQRNRIDDSKMDELVDLVAGCSDAWVVFASAAKWDDAKRFNKRWHVLTSGHIGPPEDDHPHEYDDEHEADDDDELLHGGEGDDDEGGDDEE